MGVAKFQMISLHQDFMPPMCRPAPDTPERLGIPSTTEVTAYNSVGNAIVDPLDVVVLS